MLGYPSLADGPPAPSITPRPTDRRNNVKRLAITFVAIVVVSSAMYTDDGAGAQDDIVGTVSALQTQVADLEATAQARGEKINQQRTQVADLRAETSAATPTTPLFDLEGVHDAKIYQRFAAGAYTVEAACEDEVMQVYVLDPAHGILAQPVSRTALGEDGDLRVAIPADAEYKVEIYCASRWRVTFTLETP